VARRASLALALAAALALALGAGWLACALRDRPDLSAFAAEALAAEPGPGSLRLTFLGVSTLLVSDGETALLTDGFFTRPGLLRSLAWRVAPDEAAVERALARAGIDRLAAVVVVHSHYDHAMDAPLVAERTGALLVGSPSTAQIARGLGLAEARVRVPAPGEPLAFGRFRVTLIPSRHLPHGMAMGTIDAPLVPPARATAYKEGGSYSVWIEHERGRLLVQGSAGFEPGALRDVRADVVLLGIGGLGTRDAAYRESYWRETVEAVGARRVVPIHFDDFTRPLGEPPAAMPNLLDDVAGSLRFLRERAGPGRDVRLAPAWRAVGPLAGLPPAAP
jgi:L-ascorbate metabolism protein UlaG (beta-lactamase superfamily)